MKHITSPKNPHVRQALRLRDRRDRREQRRFLIDGLREIDRALVAGIALDELYVCEERLPPAGREVQARAVQAGPVTLLRVTPAVFARLAYGERSEGLVAVAKMPERTLAALEPRLPPDPVIAVLEGVEKPGNLGAVARSADAAGISALVAAGRGADLFHPNAIRASLGTVLTLPAAAADAAETLAWLRGRGLRIFAARVDGAVDYTAADFRPPCAIVLGSEAEGLGELWRAADVTAVRLPLCGAADSLNVSATAAVLFYEALRQRRAAVPGSAASHPRR